MAVSLKLPEKLKASCLVTELRKTLAGPAITCRAKSSVAEEGKPLLSFTRSGSAVLADYVYYAKFETIRSLKHLPQMRRLLPV